VYTFDKEKMKNIKNDVDQYIAKAPKILHEGLKQIRKIIKDVTPGAIERTDYFQIPGYSYSGYDYDGMFVWFSYKDKFIRLHVRPPVIDNHKEELKIYKKTKAIVSFPGDKKLPVTLIKRLVKESLKVMKSKRKI
jgi:uncharacterized protein YdhG (YjbR/CyaY superfamily)